MKKLLVLFIFLFSWIASSNDKLKLAYEYLEKSDLKNAIILFEELTAKEFKSEEAAIFKSSFLGLAEAYTDLGAYHLSNKTLNKLVAVLDNTCSKDYLTFAKVHRQFADNYDLLFLSEAYLTNVNKFIKFYRLAAPKNKMYEAVYHAYLGRYYNLKFDLATAYKNTTRALNIYHKNKNFSNLIDVYKVYESHCFTLRNTGDPQSVKESYIDTLKQKTYKLYPNDNVKRARALIPLSSLELDYAYNTLSNSEILMSDKVRKNLIHNSTINYKKGIDIYKSAGFNKHDYLPRYYNLQSWIYYGNKDYSKALKLNNNAIKSYSDITFLEEGFVANNTRILSSIRFKVIALRKLRETTQNQKINEDYIQTLLLYEKLWEQLLLEQVQNKSDFVSNMYNQNPYQYLFEYYAQLYKKNNDYQYLTKAHLYEEKSKYGSLLLDLSLSNLDKNKRLELAKLKGDINILLEEHYVSKFLNKLPLNTLKIQETINLFNDLRNQLNINDLLKIEGIDEIQNKLNYDEALVSFNNVGLGVNDLYAKVITKQTSNLIYIGKTKIGENVIFRSLMNSLNKSMTNSDINKFKVHSYNLYNKLFKPITSQLPKTIKKIEIIRFADIENLPFDILLSETSSSQNFRELPYLLNNFTFHYLQSSSINQINTQNKNDFAVNLSIVNPTFKNTTQSTLTYATKAAKELSQVYNANLLYNKKATLKNFKNSLLNSKVVSLISHGISSSDSKKSDKGIYLQDTFLSMEDIYKMTSKTEFLILTACQTGNGFKDSGEGNINLVRAFRSIGVKSILNAYWDIDEKPSMNILKDFFNNLNKGLKKSQALKEAKKQYLKTCIPRYGNPIYWAGLNLVGDNASVTLKNNEPEKINFIIWILVILILLTIAYGIKKYF